MMEKITAHPYWPYFLLAARLLLAWTLVRYGWAKLTDNQFGVDDKTLNLPLKEVDLFRLSWYLADHQPFKAFIGLSQIVTALLLVITRTRLLGAFISIPIWLNILLWDMTFMEGFTAAFTFRLSFYLILTGLLIAEDKKRAVPALRHIISPGSKMTSYPVWAYVVLPLAVVGVDFIWAIPSAIWSYLHLTGR
jgi:uncharacterized membrane protein YphA (DoxX/SURF4 family)